MTDREMLELAARAAGITCWHGVPYTNGRIWDPLDDDGDALRLAVKMGLCLDFARGWTAAYAGSRTAEQISERHNDSPYAATRRAIVRAAAEIGRQMEETT